MADKRIELNGEEILKTLSPLRRRYAVYKIIRKVINGLVTLGVIACFVGPFLLFKYEIVSGDTRLYFMGFMAIDFVLIGFRFACGKLCDKAKRKYADTYKQLISRPVLDSCFDNAQFEPDAGYPREEFRASGLLPIHAGHTYTSEDLITGTYKGVAFRRADIRITHESGGKHKTTVVDADGRLLEVAFHKEIRESIRIVKEPKAIRLFSEDVLVETEDMDFNQKFNVYARDKHSAFYFLTPPVIEYFKQMYDRDDAIYITFNGEKLYFLISGHGGIFEPPYREFDIWDEVRKCKSELEEIREIIEDMQFDVVARQEEMLKDS